MEVDFPSLNPIGETAMRIWKALTTTTLACVALIAAPAIAGEGQDRVTATITATPYAMKAFKDGADISDRWPVKAIRYAKDGTALSTLADGKEIKSNWTLDAEGKLLVLLCHKRSFALALPQQGHCPRRAISS